MSKTAAGKLAQWSRMLRAPHGRLCGAGHLVVGELRETVTRWYGRLRCWMAVGVYPLALSSIASVSLYCCLLSTCN